MKDAFASLSLGVFARTVFERDRSAELFLRLLGGTMDNTIADLVTAQQLSYAFEERPAVDVQKRFGEAADDG